MNFIEEWGFSVRKGQEEAFQEWMAENEGALRGASPKGSEYVGTYAVIYSTEKQAGGYKLLVRHDSYADLDVAAAAGKDKNSEFARLTRDLLKFWDTADTAPWSRSLLKGIVEATVWKTE